MSTPEESRGAMFNKILQTAHETGAEILLQLKDFCCEQYKGRVLELDEEYFSLFHSGPGGGVHWVFKRADIAFVGLIVELPELQDANNSQTNVVEHSSESLKEEGG